MLRKNAKIRLYTPPSMIFPTQLTLAGGVYRASAPADATKDHYTERGAGWQAYNFGFGARIFGRMLMLSVPNGTGCISARGIMVFWSVSAQ